MPTEDRDHHLDRARTELERAYRSESHVAARAHFGLASLHMKRIREVDGRYAEPAPENLADSLGAALPY